MSRYQALRHIGCDPLTAAFIAMANWACGVPKGRIVCMSVEIDISDMEQL